MIGGPTSGAHVPVKPPNLISLQPMSWQTSDTQLFMQLPDDLLIVLVLETVQERDRVLGGGRRVQRADTETTPYRAPAEYKLVTRRGRFYVWHFGSPAGLIYLRPGVKPAHGTCHARAPRGGTSSLRGAARGY